MSDAVDKIPRVNLLPVSTPAACSNSPVTPPLTPLLSETAQITDTTSTAANQPISKFVCLPWANNIIIICLWCLRASSIVKLTLQYDIIHARLKF